MHMPLKCTCGVFFLPKIQLFGLAPSSPGTEAVSKLKTVRHFLGITHFFLQVTKTCFCDIGNPLLNLF